MHDLMMRQVGFRVLSGQGATIDTSSAGGKLIFVGTRAIAARSFRRSSS
jgi:hypothetical protein